MSKKKPDNTSMADQLKGLAAKMEADKTTALEAEKNARARQKQAEEDAKRAKEAAISDEERFARAVGGMLPTDRVKKFDDSPRAKREAAAAVPKKTDEDLFLEAMGRPPPKIEKKG